MAISTVAGSWCPSLSPSGDRVAYITDRDGSPRVEIGPIEINCNATTSDGTPATRVVSGPDQEAISVSWSPDGRWLTYLVSPGGSIRAELYAVRPDGSDRRLLAGGGGLETVFAGLWTTVPGQYAFSMADGTGPDAAVWLVDVETSRVEVVESSIGIGFCTVTSVSANGRRAVVRCGPRNRRRLLLLDLDGERVPIPLLQRSFPEGGDTGEDGRFAPDHRSVYLRTAAGRERVALCQVQLDEDGRPGELTVVAERDGADLEFYAMRPDGRTAVLVWNVDGESVACIKDLESGLELPIPLGEPVMPGWSLARDGLSMIAELTGPTSPRSLVRLVLPTAAGGAASVRPLDGLPVPELPDVLVRPTLHRYSAPDGLELHGLLFRPRTAHGPGPTVISFHGGPESQERPAFSLLTQSLVAAGITVFAPNVRGSSGYGASFLAADDGPSRTDSFQDVTATVEFLVDAGWARPGSIGVQGWSYGGYLALTALTRWPELFAAGTTHAGMSDLLSFFAETETWMAAASVTEYGDPVLSADLLRALSPLTHLSRVIAPTLLVHGAQDTNVPVGESIRAHAALKSAGVPTELVLLEGEGHTIVGAPHRAELALAICGWFVRWLVRS
ncbi:dipeptidyl aminopeptidase/acylaminoacyl peptidase [Nakamurella sp. UYEF19]|uniref:S9 family peptidase n=1 Tax=Nakamurella sp. UYEF19 TaxID=1756392 RepID=UPI0033999B32